MSRPISDEDGRTDRRTHHPRAPRSREGFVHGRGPERRSFERGGIKFAVLEMVRDRARHGYDIIRAMEEQAHGLYSPSPGVIYPTLQALEDQDLVTRVEEEGKKVYSITDAGLAYLEENKERVESHRKNWEAQFGRGSRGDTRAAVAHIRGILWDMKDAVRTSAGEPTKLKEIEELLEETAARVREIVER